MVIPAGDGAYQPFNPLNLEKKVPPPDESGEAPESPKEFFGNSRVTIEKVMELTEGLPKGSFVTVGLYKDPT